MNVQVRNFWTVDFGTSALPKLMQANYFKLTFRIEPLAVRLYFLLFEVREQRDNERAARKQ